MPEQGYKVTLKSQLFIVRELVVFAFGGLVGYIIFQLYQPGDPLLSAKFFIAGYLVLCFIPSAVIHLQYSYYNDDTTLEVDELERRFSLIDKGSMRSFGFDQIKCIRLALRPEFYKGRSRGWVPWELYHYAVIETKDSNRFLITCLLVNDLRKFFMDLGLEVQRDWVIIPLVRMSRYRDKGVGGW